MNKDLQALGIASEVLLKLAIPVLPLPLARSVSVLNIDLSFANISMVRQLFQPTAGVTESDVNYCYKRTK